MDPPVNHSDYEELAAGFALGALEPDDEQAFHRHLEGCPSCRSSLREFEELTSSMALAAPQVEPPASLRAGIRRETGLTQPPPGRVYELWGLPGGDEAQATKVVVFRFNDRQGVRAVEFSVPLWPTTGFAITEEPGPGGSPHPTTEPVLAGAPQPRPGGA